MARPMARTIKIKACSDCKLLSGEYQIRTGGLPDAYRDDLAN